jgi:hypothetical protein
MMLTKKQKKLSTIIIVICAFALLLSSFAPSLVPHLPIT